MTMPLSSRILFTVVSVQLAVGAHLADYATSTHIFNPSWPPHAKFHTGQTLSMAIFLSVFTLFFAWRRSSDRKTAVYAAAGFASAYWITQATAILYPGTAFLDPEFVTATSFPLGLPPQAFIQIISMALILIASWLALRPQAKWID